MHVLLDTHFCLVYSVTKQKHHPDSLPTKHKMEPKSQ